MNQLNLHWASLIEIARNCSEHNVTLNRLNGSNQFQLCTRRPIKQDECLRLWPDHCLLNEWKISDYLELANFLGINQYKCINCSKIYEEPNQLKIHIALSCNKFSDDQQTDKIADNLLSLSSENQLNKQIMCNNLLLTNPFRNVSLPTSQYQSNHKNSIINSTHHLGFNPFNLASSSSLSSNNKTHLETILKSNQFNSTNFNSNLASLNHLLINPTSVAYQESLNNINLNNTTNSINLNLTNLNLSCLNSSNNLMNNNIGNLINQTNQQFSNHPMNKRRKLDDSGNDLLNALNKLNSNFKLNDNLRSNVRSIDLNCIDGLNKMNNKIQFDSNHLNSINQLNGINSLNTTVNKLNGTNHSINNGKLNGSNRNSSNDINLMDSDQSSNTTDDLLNDKVVTSSSMSLLNMNSSSKNRALKSTKEPRTHTCKFCGKLYTRKVSHFFEN